MLHTSVNTTKKEIAPRRIHVSDDSYQCLSKIISGSKKYEGGLANKVNEWDLYVGKYIDLYCDTREVRCQITSLLYFDDFGEAYDKLGEKLMPDMNRESVIKMYNSFYTKYDYGAHPCDAIIENGVVCIGINVIRVF